MSENGAPHRTAFTRRRFLQTTGRVGLGGLIASRIVTGYAAETIVLSLCKWGALPGDLSQKTSAHPADYAPAAARDPFAVFNDA